MNEVERRASVHPAGEEDPNDLAYPAPHRVETMGGPVQVSWEADPGISPHGLLTYFVEFLHVSGLWEEFVDQCPLRYTSPNAPSKAEILGTILCGVLNGHRRHAHISGMRGDPGCPSCWGSGGCGARAASGAPSRNRMRRS